MLFEVSPQPCSDIFVHEKANVTRVLKDDICRSSALLLGVHDNCLARLPDVRIVGKSRHPELLQPNSRCSGGCYRDCAEDVHHLSYPVVRRKVNIRIL